MEGSNFGTGVGWCVPHLVAVWGGTTLGSLTDYIFFRFPEISEFQGSIQTTRFNYFTLGIWSKRNHSLLFVSLKSLQKGFEFCHNSNNKKAQLLASIEGHVLGKKAGKCQLPSSNSFPSSHIIKTIGDLSKLKYYDPYILEFLLMKASILDKYLSCGQSEQLFKLVMSFLKGTVNLILRDPPCKDFIS